MRVAVLLPVFNGEKTIEKAIRSLLCQTYDIYRLVLVDNGSTDNTVKIVTRLMDESLKDWTLLTCEEKGIVPALNKGLFEIMSEGNSNLIARLDADDAWLPTKLEQQVKFMQENPDIDICGTQIIRVVNGAPIQEQMLYPTEDAAIKAMLLRGNNAIAHPSVVYRPKVVLRTGGYDSTYPIAEDYHLWLKCILWFNFANLQDKLVEYNVSHNPKYNPRTPQLCAISMKTAIEQLGK